MQAEILKKDRGRKIIFDRILVYRYFGLDPSLVITALVLVMSKDKKAFGPMEVQTTTQLAKIMKSQPLTQQLTKHLPIFLNTHMIKYMQFPLDRTGRVNNFE